MVPLIAGRDTPAVLKLLEQFHDQAEVNRLLSSGVIPVARVQPEEAAAMVDAFLEAFPHQAASAMVSVSSTSDLWARADPEAAAQWAFRIGDRAGRDAAISGVASGWLRRSPEQAQQWVLRLPEEVRDRAAMALINTAAFSDYQIGSDFVRAFVANEEQQRQLGRILGFVAEHEPQRASFLVAEWLTDPAVRQEIERAIEALTARYSLATPGSAR